LAVLEIDYQIVLGRCLGWQVGGLFALDATINVAGRSRVLFEWIWTLGDTTPARGVNALPVNGGKLVGRQPDDQSEKDCSEGG